MTNCICSNWPCCPCEKLSDCPNAIVADTAGTSEVTDEMVSRFLGWRLPDDFLPDCGVSFKPLGHPNGWPTGTNLFTADQARAMLEHVLAGCKTDTAVAKPRTLNFAHYEAFDAAGRKVQKEIDAFKAAISESVAAPTAPSSDTAGAKTVPHEPTKEMLEAGREQLNRMGFVKDVWQAMYCAAPETGEKNAFREGFKNALRFPPLGYAAPPAPLVADATCAHDYVRSDNVCIECGREFSSRCSGGE